jgi:septal ring factor EnvC (AmiA/AmiB activator)
MTTIEARNEHLEKQNKELKTEISRLQGDVHAQKLEVAQLIKDINHLQDMCNARNVQIAKMEQTQSDAFRFAFVAGITHTALAGVLTPDQVAVARDKFDDGIQKAVEGWLVYEAQRD